MLDKFVLVDLAVPVKWSPRAKRHFVQRGYEFTRMGNAFMASVQDLPPGSKIRVKVKCPYCKKERTVMWQAVANKESTACQRCASHEASFKDLTGKIFGRLAVIQVSDKRGNDGQFYFDCICECGNEKAVSSQSLLSGGARSCGCLQREVASERMASLTGSKNYKWDSTRTDEDRDSFHRSTGHRKWREAVLERDGNECVRCDSAEDLHAHHIYPYSEYPEMREDVDNGVTLCKICHDEFHLEYGQVGVADEELAAFLTKPTE